MLQFNITPQNKSYILSKLYQLGREYNWDNSTRIDKHLNVVKTRYSHPTVNTQPTTTLEEALDIFYQQIKEKEDN